jgi:hypothetical protein
VGELLVGQGLANEETLVCAEHELSAGEEFILASGTIPYVRLPVKHLC